MYVLIALVACIQVTGCLCVRNCLRQQWATETSPVQSLWVKHLAKIVISGDALSISQRMKSSDIRSVNPEPMLIINSDLSY